ncbi:YhcN/YlaJ family sporulation lipoprotein [Salipaludibacillus sp. LMS25]|jgi:YhcN/YlaJ family sporulation lipoprotein|uniref:YhcN/YlaJ family sporulation lipoprotein n=1 Tax=Salipaludibacillus sp. LMS25 TaxID=2924031 RepID=UPI0020D0E317|nr:YhcN/YlaJ family sporulation lipoprotein [Salipaludibacillus sp. LMS25]UTR15227.1 YhcN/YlaJ family sporulation lipoprotein [Salipaludibacillus sp. LMS25]
MKQVIRGLILGLILLTVGCQMDGDNTNNDTIEGQQFQATESEMTTFNEAADHLAELAVQVPEVNRSAAIVFGPYAIVALDVEAGLDQSHVGTVKYQVAETLADDPYGANAAITADPDILQRLEDMRKEMGDGRPFDAIGDEIAGIFGRLVPVVPTEEHREEPLEEPKDQTHNENELENIQEKQSKGRIDSH